MISDFFKSKVVRFLAFFLLLVIGWKIIYEQLIHPRGVLDRLVINNTVDASEGLLHVFGYKTFDDQNETIRTLGIDGTHGLWIGDPCNGITLFALFTAFLVAFPGPWKHKAWFIPGGILLIHSANILRITLLCIIVKAKPEWLDFNHTYTFQILMYAIIFLLWMWWVKRFSGLQLPKKERQDRMRRKNNLLALLLGVVYVATGFFREFVFLNINEQSRVTYYHADDSQVAPSMRFLEHMSYTTLYYAKYPLTLLFSAIFALMACVIIRLLFGERKYVRLTLVIYAGVFLLSLLFFAIGKLTGQSESFYEIARFIAGLVETPALLIVLVPAFFLATNSNSSER